MAAVGQARAAARWTDVDWSADVHDAVIDGRRLRYADRGEGPALVLLHGLGACWQWWLENITELASAHRVIAVDLPGFGASDVLAPPAEIAAHADAVFALCDALGIETMTPVGHSMGGLVALAMATSRPERMERLVLVDAGGVPMSERRLKAVLVGLRVANLVLKRPWVQRAMVRRPAVRKKLLGAAMRDPSAITPQFAAEIAINMSPPGFLGAVAASGRAVRTAVPQDVACDVLLVWGEHDPIVGVRHARDMKAKLKSAQLTVVGGAGHSPQVEDPDTFNAAVLAFTSA